MFLLPRCVDFPTLQGRRRGSLDRSKTAQEPSVAILAQASWALKAHQFTSVHIPCWRLQRQMASFHLLTLLVYGIMRVPAAVNLGYLSSVSTAVPTPDKWPTAAPKNAWIWNMHHSGDAIRFMYDPVMLTVGEALRDHGAKVAFVSKDNLDSDDSR
eukprot:8553175-Pyramimonas_sp.AAC.1